MSIAIDTSALEGLGLTKKKESATGSNEMGQDAFLKLVIAQLENQDPMKPMENGEFLSQLAQFQSVTGIDDLKNSVEKLAGTFQSNQALQASSLVGRWVMVEGDEGQLWPDAGIAGSIELDEPAEQVLLSIKDESGQMVHQIDLGKQDAGNLDFHWDGVDGNGVTHPPGTYIFDAQASISGEYKAVTTNTIVPVDSVIMGGGGTGITVNAVGVGKIKLSDVKEIM
ncbi:flagellar hook assembly protein FlgD [Pseudomonadota bacterium]